MRIATCLWAALPVVFGAGGIAAEPVALDPADFELFEAAQVEAGWLLFYDPILAGNQNISCGTCHHPQFATSDGVSLGIGEGGIGLGPDRVADPANLPEQRIPRNAPALFNLGHADVRVLFHDGRIEVDPSRPSGLRTPLGEEMVQGFSGLLSAQTMFPVLSADEMAGHYQENDVALAVRRGMITGPDGAWDIIAKRVDAIPAYRALFEAFDPEIAAGAQIAFTDISDAVAAFMAVEWRADETPFDVALRGGPPLDPTEQIGQSLFFGAAGCGSCHSGALLSDQQFHAMALPQLGPGKAARFEDHQRDDGRFRVTGDPGDAYAFRTPMLRNVVETGPWGHAGGHSDLREFIRYHADPLTGLQDYAPQATLPAMPLAKSDWAIMEDTTLRGAIEVSYTLTSTDTALDEHALDAIVAFLHALSDPTSLNGRMGIPSTVPSGLPVDR